MIRGKPKGWPSRWPARKGGLRKVSPRRRQELALDHQARLACLLAAQGRCEWCGSMAELEWHHVVTRRVRTLRWLPDNAVALCVPCHRKWHRSPRAGLLWFVERFGEDRLARLRALRP